MKKTIITLLTLALGIPAFAQGVLPPDKIVPPQHKEQVEPIERVLQRLVALRLFVQWCATDEKTDKSINFSPEEVEKFMNNIEAQLRSSEKSKEELSAIFKALSAFHLTKQTEFAQEHHLTQDAWCKLQQKVWTANGYGALFEEEKGVK